MDGSLATKPALLAEKVTIALTDAGKKFNRDWIFRNLNYTFQSGKNYAITGPNGSGKSTLLQVLASSTNVSEGKIYVTTQSNSDPVNVPKLTALGALGGLSLAFLIKENLIKFYKQNNFLAALTSTG